MPNGGQICCEYCTYNRLTPGRCDVFGVETSPFLRCRMFRMPGQSHVAARREHPELLDLKAGEVYEIDNTTCAPPRPRRAYRTVRVR